MITPYLRILKKRNFFLLWSGQIISQFGDRLTQMALIGLVYRLEPHSTVGLAKMFSLAIIPVFLISPVAGVYVDRWDKRKTMCVSDLLRGIFIFLIPLMFFRFHNPLIVYVIIFFSFCVGRFFIPAKMAIIPSLVAKEDFFLANSLVSITAMIAAILGFGFGGVIVERWGIKTAFLLDAATFFLSSFFIFFIHFRQEGYFNPKDIIHLSRDAIVKIRNSFFLEAKEGISYILHSKETRYATKVMFALFAFIGSLYTVFIVFMQETLSTVTLQLGWLAVVIGAGLFFGSLVYGRFGAKLPVKKMINLSLGICGLYLIFFVFFLRYHPYQLFALLFCFFLGLIASPIIIAVNTLVHKESDNMFWGRIFSCLEIVIHLAFIVFMFLAAYLAEAFSPFAIIIGIGIIVFLFSLLSFIQNND